ncbi:uncharacterized protein STEHIDRAFT_116962 [Stereum hirsutum FP-91666 SS1]|uniref:uncharacterized protein n=1 Tax=Stereum hirsutum (strain FP-91666) TaxID=721885 RepID=UPI000440FF69|nr:uncharacterized protein STEHIDRAFT_116962 [Stereum hirsutum FP-91666 SS1]EIM91834.1 hypothetical protein STEHIDRAFT_116962 [Stereum hirsutum FP-91666 SS1]
MSHLTSDPTPPSLEDSSPIELSPLPTSPSISPISRLPDELLTRIFAYHQPQAATWKSYTAKKHRHLLKADPAHPLGISLRENATGWLSILHTCYRWRSVAFQCGAFWSNVVIDGSEYGRKDGGREDKDVDKDVNENSDGGGDGVWYGEGGMRLSLTEMMLERSKTAELAVTYWHKEDERRAFDRIMDEVSRIRHLHVIGADRELCEIITHALTDVARGGRRDALRSLIYATVETDFKASMPLMDRNVLESLPPTLDFLAFCGQLGSSLARNPIVPRHLSHGGPINLGHIYLCLTPPIDIASLESTLTYLPNLQTLSLRLRTYGASPGAFITLPSPLLVNGTSPPPVHLPHVYLFDYDGPLYVYNHLSTVLRIPENAHRHLTLSVNGADVEDVKGLIGAYRPREVGEVKFERVNLGMTRRAPEYLGMGSLELDLYISPSPSPALSDSSHRRSLPRPSYPRAAYDTSRLPEYASLFLTLRFFFVSAERQAEIVTELYGAVGYGDVRNLGLRVTVPSLGTSYGGGDEGGGESGRKPPLGVPVLGALKGLRRLEVKGCDGLASLVSWMKEQDKEREEGQHAVGDLEGLKELVLDGVGLESSSSDDETERAGSARVVALEGRYETLLDALVRRKERGVGLERVVFRGCGIGEGMLARFRESRCGAAVESVEYDGAIET